MDALFIINSKNNDLLLSKEFRQNESHLKLQTFFMEFLALGKKGPEEKEKSPYLLINETIFIYLQDSLNAGVLYLALISEDNLITSVYKILENINSALTQAFDNSLTVDLIRDNFVEIILMIDQYLINGIPTISEVNALSGLISPYGFKDKLTEKFIGKAKDYDTRTLMNYIRETQTTYENSKYSNENIKNNYEILFHYTDILEVSYDKNFALLHKNLYSVIEVFSKIAYNIEMNLLLNIPFNVLDFSIDESVQTKKKEILKKKNLDCYIKHGNYTLMQMVPAFNIQITLPLKITVVSNITNNNCNLHIQIDLESVRDLFYIIEDVQIRIYFPDTFTNSNLTVNVGDFEFSNKNMKEKIALWNISQIDKTGANMKGNLVVDTSSVNTNNCVMQLSCKIDKFSLSGGSISKGTISKNPKNLDVSKKGRNFTIIKNLEIVF